MADRNLDALEIGTQVKLKNGKKLWEYRGMNEEGKILLLDPESRHVTLVVKKEEVDWKTIRKK